MIGPGDPWDDPVRPVDPSKGSGARSDGGARTKEFYGGERTVCRDFGCASTVEEKRKDFRTARMDRSWVGGNRRSRTWSPGIVRPIVVPPTEPRTVEGEDIFDTKDDLGTPSRRRGRFHEDVCPPLLPLRFWQELLPKGGIAMDCGSAGTRDWARPSTTDGTDKNGAWGVRRRVT